MNKKTIALGGTLLTLGALVFGTQTAFAYRGDPSIQGPNYSAERHEEMTVAFANNDYNTWKGLMNGKGRVSEVINEENFARFAEAHRLALEGKTDEAEAIRNELGLGLRDGSGRGRGQGVMDGTRDGNGRWKTE